MKNILFDFVTLQDNFINGGILYAEKVLNELLKSDVKIFGAFDSQIQNKSEKFNEFIRKYKIELIDLRSENFVKKIDDYKVDVFFISVAQRLNHVDLTSLKCKIVIVCHDVVDKCLNYSKVLESAVLKEFEKSTQSNKRRISKEILKTILYPLVLVRRHIHRGDMVKKRLVFYNNFERLIKKENVFLVTVSEYSKSSIEYFFGKANNNIKILYAQLVKERDSRASEASSYIKDLVEQNNKYFLVISSNRSSKNLPLVLEQWEKFSQKTDFNFKCIMTGIRKPIEQKENCVYLDYVNPSDLNYLFKNAFSLIYPSFGEGFGLPPVEAASYGVPSVCSNVTAIPEICGDMAVYFSPFYPEDLYRAMLEMVKNREYYAEKTRKRFKEIEQRQKDDLNKLIELILN